MPELTRRQVVLVLGAAIAFLTLAVGVYGPLTGPDGHGGGAQDPELMSSAGPGPSADVIHADPSRRTLPRTDDPISLARAIASALFDWDTASGFLPADYQAPVLAEADPSGEETPGLIDDIGTYMPTVEEWLDLATMKVTQNLTIESAAVPASWQSVVEQDHGELRPGTTAVTITGTRSRTGVWNGDRAATSSPVAFTVFVACGPAFERCHVLRLSELDNPLR